MNTSPNPEFDALVSGLRESMRDPVVTELIEHVQQAEAMLNANHPQANSNEIQDAISIMNYTLDGLRLLDTEILVSGKLRLDSSEYEERDDEMLEHWRVLYGEVLEDAKGPYFLVHQLALECGEFDIYTDESEIRNPHRYGLQMSSVVEEDTPTQLYVFVDELDEFIPREPSIAFIARELQENYPALVAQLDTLPEDCEDDARIMEALEDFILEIDWSLYPSVSEEERGTIITYAERYMEQRLKFDTALYEFEIQGPYYKRGTKNDWLRQYADLLSVKRGHIDGISLKTLSSIVEPEGIQTFAPELVVVSSSSRRGAGNEQLIIPVFVVESLHNLRNPYEEHEGDGAEFQQEREYGYPVDIPNQTDDSESQDSNETTEAIEENAFEVKQSREEQLAAVLEKLNILVSHIQMIGEMHFTDDDALRESSQLITTYAQEFFELYRAAITPIEVSGPGVLSVVGSIEHSYDENNDTIHISVSGTEALEADLLTFEKGVFTGIASLIEENDDKSKSLKVLLKFNKLNTDDVIYVGNQELPNFSFIDVEFAQHFAARLDKGISITLPEYDRIKSAQRQIEQIAKRYPDMEQLPEVLTKLSLFMQQADPQTYSDFPDVGLIHSIGEMVAGDGELVDKVSTAIVDIMAEAQVYLIGMAYDEEGELIPDIELNGKVIDIVPEVKVIPESVPMLKIENYDETIYYVPFTSIERLRI